MWQLCVCQTDTGDLFCPFHKTKLIREYLLYETGSLDPARILVSDSPILHSQSLYLQAKEFLVFLKKYKRPKKQSKILKGQKDK